MKDFFILRKSKLLLFALLAMLVGGVSPAWADAKALPYSYGFENNDLETDGWTKTITTSLSNNNKECGIVESTSNTPAAKTGNYGFRFSSANTSGANAQYLISPELNGSKGVNVSFYYKSSNTGTYGTESFKVGYSTTDTEVTSFTWGEENTTNAASWLLYENSFPAGTKYVAIYYYSNYKYRLYVDDFSFSAPLSGPALAVADGSTTINSGYNYNFGLATPGTVHYFTLSNPGTESITLNIAATNGFSTDNSSLTLDAKASSLLHVIMADATATGTVTITPTAAGIDPFVINVSGTVADPNKVFETLLTGSKPEDWTTSGTWTWSTTNGVSNTTYYESSNYRVITPLLTVADGETFFFDARGTYSGYQGVKFEYSADGTNWTASSTTTTLTSDWQTFTISDIPAGQYYIALHGWQCNIRNFYGGELYVPTGAKFAIDPSGATQNLGLTAIGGNLEKTFTISNAGNEALTVTFTAPTGFDVVGKATTFILTDNFGWGSAKVYAWDANQNPLNGAWPGTVDAEKITNSYGETQFKVVVPNGAVGVIVNNGSGAQTENITNFSSYEGFWMDGLKDADGHYKVTGYGTYSNPAISSLTVAAGESKSFTVKMNTATAGAKSGTLSLALSDNVLDATSPYEINLSGVVMSADAMVIDFNDNQLPAGWGNNASNKWSFADGKAYCTSAAELTTSKLQFTDGDFFVISATSYDNYDNNYIEITGSVDGTTWDAFTTKKFVSRSQIPYGSYASLVVTDIPTTVKYLKFKGYYVRIDEIAGLTFSDDAPVLGYYTNSECTTAATATVAKDFGFVSEAPEAQVYYIKNDGTGTMSIALGDVPTGFTAVLGKASLTAGESTTLTINMSAATKGYHNGDIVVTATNSSDEQIGTFTVTASGVMMEEGKLNLNFASTDVIPTTWTATDWTKNANGYYRGGYSNTTIETSDLTATAEEEIVIVAKQEYTSGSFSVNYKKVDAEEWSTLIASTSLGNSSWVTLHAPIAEAGDYKFQIIGNYYTQIQRIYGLTTVAVPFMETTAANHAFGMQTAESEEYSFTISNTGEAVLTGLSLTLGKTGDEAEYSFRMTDSENAAFTGTTLAVGQTINVYVKQLFDSNYGAKSDVLTIAADGQTTKTINLTGTTRDPSILYVDFDDPNAFPEGWLAGASWSVYTYGTDRYAYQSSSSTPSALVTTPLTMESGKTLSFKVARNSSGYGYTTSLKTRYSQDGGATWSDYAAQYGEGSSNEAGSGYTTIELSDLPTGDLIFEFFGNNIKLDMIQGLKQATAPALALTESDAAVVNGSTKAFENLKAEGTATYTLKNIGNAAMTSTVAIAGGATVAISGEGEGVTISDKTVTLAAGKSATITLTVPFEAPYADMSGAMTITTEGWVGDFAVNYTATLVDPTDFVEDFTAGKPAGWYSDGWSYTGGIASVNAGVEKPMITELIGAEDGKNTLTFNAWSTSENQELNVYTSTDRKNWTKLGETITLTDDENATYTRTLTNGNQYIKFGGVIAKIDNIKGVKKLAAPAHDLYEVSADMAATGTPGASYTATVVGVSLRADETDIKAELWFKKGEGDGATYNNIATLTDQAMTVNTNKTFTLTGNLPTEEGDYTAWVTVKKASDESVYFNTDVINFTLTHTHTMAITTFPNAAAVQADDNNQYAGTFFVTVQNTGSAAIAANDVSVSLIDNADAEHVITTAWTAESSNVLYMNTKKDATDIATDCTLKAWCWNTTEDGEWITFTNVNDGFWSLNLNGKTNFKIVRYNTAGTDENPWNNVYNQSGDLTLASGNLVKFNGYDNSALTFTAESMAYLEPTMATTLKVTVNGTLTDGENANFSFKAKENLSNTYYGNGLTSNLSVTAAPVIELDETVGTVASQGQNRKVSLKHSFVQGWNTICLPFAINATDIHASAKALAFTAYDSSTKELTFSPVTTELEANKPYVIYVPEAIANTTAINFSGKTVTTNDDPKTFFDPVTFQGTYAPMAAGSLTDKWGLTAKGKIAKANANTTMKGFRAYFDGIPAGATARFVGFDESTGIKAIDNSQLTIDNCYNLQGQKVENLKKGNLYIINGKKTVVK